MTDQSDIQSLGFSPPAPTSARDLEALARKYAEVPEQEPSLRRRILVIALRVKGSMLLVGLGLSALISFRAPDRFPGAAPSVGSALAQVVAAALALAAVYFWSASLLSRGRRLGAYVSAALVSLPLVSLLWTSPSATTMAYVLVFWGLLASIWRELD